MSETGIVKEKNPQIAVYGEDIPVLLPDTRPFKIGTLISAPFL
jgi:hypothetical protein